jgi:peptide deformylase
MKTMSVDPPEAVEIVRIGHPSLRQLAAPISDAVLGSSAFRDLVAVMRVTLEGTGVGLAAPQIGVGLRLFVMEDPPEWCEKDPLRKEKDREPFPFTVVVNPQWRALGDERAEFLEGCLSIPEFQAKVPRFTKIEARWLDQHAAPQAEVLTGWKARVFQHEFDHLDGKLYIDYLKTKPAVSYPDIGKGVSAELLARLSRRL